jgi:hypothetical protein
VERWLFIQFVFHANEEKEAIHPAPTTRLSKAVIFPFPKKAF